MASVKQPIKVDFYQFSALRERLKEAGIKYERVYIQPAAPGPGAHAMPADVKHAYWYE